MIVAPRKKTNRQKFVAYLDTAIIVIVYIIYLLNTACHGLAGSRSPTYCGADRPRYLADATIERAGNIIKSWRQEEHPDSGSKQS